MTDIAERTEVVVEVVQPSHQVVAGAEQHLPRRGGDRIVSDVLHGVEKILQRRRQSRRLIGQ